jgi:outer membrane protein insertion porin family
MPRTGPGAPTPPPERGRGRLRRAAAGPGGVALALLAALALAAAPAPARAAAPGDSLLRAYDGRTLGRYTFSGNRVTKDYVIARELELRPGRPLAADSLTADVVRLENLSIFSSIRPVFTAGDSAVDLDLVIKEMPPLVPYPAVSYNEIDGWSVGLGVASLNLLGRAISLSGSALPIGTTQVRAKFSYPWISGNHFGLAASYASLDRYDALNGFREGSDQITPQVSTYLGRHGRLRGIFDYLGMTSDTDGKTLSPDNRDDLVRLGFALGYDSRDSYRRPTRGWQNEVQVLRTGGFLPGDGDFWSGDLDLRYYQQGFARHTLRAGALLSLQSGTVGEDIPVYLQYRMGGANSIRGYDPLALGQELYGKNQYILTFEYGFPVRPIREYRVFKWTISLGLDVAAFLDHGLAWSEAEEISLKRSRTGIGAGFRLLVPGMEQFRFDFAVGEGGEFQFHFASGAKMPAQRNRIR